MILDATDLRDYFDRHAEGHWVARAKIEFLSSGEQLVVSPFVIAELEPMIRAEFGTDGWLAVLDELSSGAWAIAGIDPGHLGEVADCLRELLPGTGPAIATVSNAVFTALEDGVAAATRAEA